MGGCLLVAVAALLALAVPASIAPTSLVGAYVVLAVLALLGVGAVIVNDRRPRAVQVDALPRRSRGFVAVAVLTVVYAAVVLLIHLAS